MYTQCLHIVILFFSINLLKLPEYPSKEELVNRIGVSLQCGSQGYGQIWSSTCSLLPNINKHIQVHVLGSGTVIVIVPPVAWLSWPNLKKIEKYTHTIKWFIFTYYLCYWFSVMNILFLYILVTDFSQLSSLVMRAILFDLLTSIYMSGYF